MKEFFRRINSNDPREVCRCVEGSRNRRRKMDSQCFYLTFCSFYFILFKFVSWMCSSFWGRWPEQIIGDSGDILGKPNASELLSVVVPIALRAGAVSSSLPEPSWRSGVPSTLSSLFFCYKEGFITGVILSRWIGRAVQDHDPILFCPVSFIKNWIPSCPVPFQWLITGSCTTYSKNWILILY